MPDSILSRVSRVITGLTHAAVDAAEQANPVAVIEQAAREIDAEIDNARVQLGKETAERHRVDLRLEELSREHADLDEKVRIALGANREDLARAGVSRQIDIEVQRDALGKIRSAAAERIDELGGMIDAMRASRREAEARLREFRDQAKHAGAPAGQGRSPAANPEGRIERAQHVIDRITGVPGESGLRDARTLEELENLRRDRAVEERLKKLRSSAA